MKGNKKRDSVGARIIKGLEEFADTIEKGEPVTEKFNCRVVELDLRPEPYSPALVKETRKLLHVSQALFALFLGVSPNTVRSWEQGANPPKDIACRFMDEIRRNPKYWRRRLRQAIIVKD